MSNKKTIIYVDAANIILSCEKDGEESGVFGFSKIEGEEYSTLDLPNNEKRPMST